MSGRRSEAERGGHVVEERPRLASTEPRFFERGNFTLVWREAGEWQASTEPRFFERGNATSAEEK